MAKKLTKFEKTIVMNTAKSCYVILDKKAKIEQKIKEKTESLQAELEAANAMLEALCETVATATDGAAPYDLVKREISTVTGEDGKEKKSTRYFFVDEESDENEAPAAEVEGSHPAEEEVHEVEPSATEELPDEKPAEEVDPFGVN